MATIRGNSGNNNLLGTSADDLLDGAAGADTMAGLGGNDRYIVDNIGDVVIENAGQGTDTVEASVSYTLGANVENLTLTGTGHINGTGNELVNVLQGNDGNNILDGGVGADSMRGGRGNDTYRVDNAGDQTIESSSSGTDTVIATNLNWTLSTNVENLVLVRDGGFAGTLVGTGNTSSNVLTGTDGNDQLLGLSGNDTLIGGAGNDSLDGGTGYDNMAGGAGDDNYIVDSSNDLVTEGVGAGIDTVSSTTDYELGANVENLVLLGTSSNDGEGNDLNNSITGNAGYNTLIGNGGDDVLSGLAGNDVLYGDAPEDDEEEEEDDEDERYSGYGSASGDDEEDDEDEEDDDEDDEDEEGGPADVPLVGGNDTLLGGAGSDELYGGDGNDVLDGGADDDEMYGGTGDDTYYVDNSRDDIEEESFEGNDTVISSISYTLSSSESLENLVLTGAALTGTGNSLNNQLTGNALNNTLSGGAGNDSLDGGLGADNLRGGSGNDLYKVDNAGDVIVENLNEGTDSVEASVSYTLGANVENLVLSGTGNIDGTGNALNNVITGNAGNNVLNGGAGTDQLIGGAGDDTYLVDGGDVITEAADGGLDTVVASADYTLGANLENLTLVGAAVAGTGNGLDNRITGNALANILNGGGGNDLLDGGLGADAMAGGTGNDVYLVDNAGDAISEGAGEGSDRVDASVSYVLAANVEDLTLVGTAAQGTGNDLDNRITGNDGDNVLSGGAGNDVLAGGAGADQLDGGEGNDELSGGAGADQLVGGAGDDTFIVDAGDTVIEGADGGIDTVISDLSWILGDNLENLVLTGTEDLSGTGNALNNRIEGNDGENVLDGGAGVDTLIGGLGKDAYIVNDLNDVIVEYADGGKDEIRSTISFDLRTVANMEDLKLVGSGDLFGYGNELNNEIIGNGQRNELLGFGGDDELIGQGNLDTLDGGDGNDRLQGGAGRDMLIGGAGEDSFVFSNIGTSNADDIDDFEADLDRIVLDRSDFSALALGRLADSNFYSASGSANAVAQTANHHIIFNTNNGQLFYDPDGVGGQAQVLFADVDIVSGTFTARDIFVEA